MTNADGSGPGLTRPDASTTAPDGAGSGLRRTRWWLLAVAIALALAAPLLIALGPLAWRLGVLDLDTSAWGLANVAKVAAAAASLFALAAIGAHALAPPRRGVIIGIAVLVLSLLTGFRIYAVELQRDSLPPVWDAQSDWSQPVPFSPAQLAARGAGSAPLADDARIGEGQGAWSGQSFAETQMAAFPLKPITVNVSVAEATSAVVEAAKRNGWTNITSDPAAGRVEGVYVSRWYGLKSDLAVRITPEGSGARIDARSASRTATGDMGANARRVEMLLGDVQFALRATEER